MSLAGDAPRYKATRAYRARRSATRPNGTRIFGVSKNRDWRPVGRRRSSRPLILIYDNRDRDLLSQTDRIIGSGVRASRSVRFCYRSRPTDSHETSLALRSSLRACIASISRDVRRVARVDHARQIACTKKSKGAGWLAGEAWSGVVTHGNASARLSSVGEFTPVDVERRPITERRGRTTNRERERDRQREQSVFVRFHRNVYTELPGYARER